MTGTLELRKKNGLTTLNRLRSERDQKITGMKPENVPEKRQQEKAV